MKQPFLFWMTTLQIVTGIVIALTGNLHVGFSVAICGSITSTFIGLQWMVDDDEP